jgi:putative nucleotidyltransferase with HDIG domain
MMTKPFGDGPWSTVRHIAQARGVRVWLVGGAVRDLLLGLPVHDWDFAVDHDALSLARSVADALVGGYFTLDAERETGRVVLADGSDGQQDLDFALLRGVDLEADLRARDFTVNAMALNAQDHLIDPTGGREDLEDRLIRATSERVFRDDALRMLRAVRLEATLGFEIESHTEDWIRRDAPLMVVPSAERVRDEFMRLLNAFDAARHVRRLEALGLLPFFIPELPQLRDVRQTAPHRFDVWAHSLMVLDALEGVLTTGVAQQPGIPLGVDAPDAAWQDLARALHPYAERLDAHLAQDVSGGQTREALLRLAALLHDLGKPETWSEDAEGRVHFYRHEAVGADLAARRLGDLRFSREAVGLVKRVIEGHLRPLHLANAERLTRRAIYRYFRALDDAGVDVALLSLADHLATWGPELAPERWARRLEVCRTLLHHYFERHEETVAPPPLLTGHDLIAVLGLQPGPQIGRLLDALREAQATGTVATRADALALVKELAGLSAT